MRIPLLALLFTTACTSMTPAASTTSVLPPERTWVIVAKPVQPAALDVARMFNQRGFALVDMHRDERGILLRFKGERKVVSEPIVTPLDVLALGLAIADEVTAPNTEEAERRRHYRPQPEPTIEHYELGSVFYVRVEPRGETMTSISAMGRPTRDTASTPARPTRT